VIINSLKNAIKFIKINNGVGEFQLHPFKLQLQKNFKNSNHTSINPESLCLFGIIILYCYGFEGTEVPISN
jgi:hypothetical protein